MSESRGDTDNSKLTPITSKRRTTCEPHKGTITASEIHKDKRQACEAHKGGRTASKAQKVLQIGDTFKVQGSTKSKVEGITKSKFQDNAKAASKSKTNPLRESAISQSNASMKTQIARPIASKPLSVSIDVTSKHTSVTWATAPESDSKNARHVPRSIKYQVWRRDGGRCTNCGTCNNINFDHIRPVALGGGAEADNLRLLCFNCNQRQAIKSFGLANVERFWG